MTKHKPLGIKHFEKNIETDADQFRKKFKGKKFMLSLDGMGNIKNCDTADKEIIKWLKEKGLDEI